MKKSKSLPFLLLSCFLALCGPAGAAVETEEQRMRWFDEARFGLFIHWGVYAVPAGEWQGKPVGGIGEWIMKNGQIPVTDYRAFAKDFTAAKYEPAAWAKLARTAGMKYMVITSKHHDGFALYDSDVTDWDVMASGAKRDLLAPLAAAARKEGLKFGLYYSQAQDWNHPGGGKAGNKSWDPAQEGDYDQYLQKIALPQVKEIVARYQPAILWWDTPVNMTAERVKPFAEFMALHPEIINNNRLGTGFKGDTKTPEQHIPPRGYPGERFEVCMTMNDTWGYKKNDHNWKSVRQILRNLSDIASKGGNFLLNVGPTPEGQIPPESVERLEAVGKWMAVNGEAIHGTQPGPFPRRLPWGRVTRRDNADGSATLYAQIWDWPEDRRILLPTVTSTPRTAKFLAGGAAASCKKTPEGLMVELPEKATDADVSVIRLDFTAPVSVTQEPFITPGPDGRVVFRALDADANGHYDGNIQVRGSGADTYLTDWKNPKWSLEYQLKTAKAATWNVLAEVAAPEATALEVEAAKKISPVKIEATGPGLSWKKIALGTIDLPVGETSFVLRGAKEGWKTLSVRHLWLEPVNP
ncbi:MAG: alpha-L-fucosidase [Candidatus Methylacidiphilales bacterium]|nr:alpha-L-fucosidase [Candidatus Methylacidiphilales bacterium]